MSDWPALVMATIGVVCAIAAALKSMMVAGASAQQLLVNTHRLDTVEAQMKQNATALALVDRETCRVEKLLVERIARLEAKVGRK